MTILVTGGAGFIGTTFIREWVELGLEKVVNLDLLTYAGNEENLASIPSDRHLLVKGSIGDMELVKELLRVHRPRAVVHLAAESHVDRSIGGPSAFIETNIVGSFGLLEAARDHLGSLSAIERGEFRFLHVSTDEVYGSLSPSDPPFTEGSPYAPSSPYSASKAASDHLAKAYARTYGIPAVVTNCSNNYGPWQHPEKLIPLMISRALENRPLPVYGDGRQVRDWLWVSDHCAALRLALAKGRPGESYNVGGGCEMANIEVVEALCSILDDLAPACSPRRDLIAHVADRPGHDRRYAVDSSKIRSELGWAPKKAFSDGLRETAAWYLARPEWARRVLARGRRHGGGGADLWGGAGGPADAP